MVIPFACPSNEFHLFASLRSHAISVEFPNACLLAGFGRTHPDELLQNDKKGVQFERVTKATLD